MPYPPRNRERSLDPQDWPLFRDQGHRMLDDMFDYLEQIRERPVWQPMPEAVRASFRDRLPIAGAELSAVHEEFLEKILPYSTGNVHRVSWGGCMAAATRRECWRKCSRPGSMRIWPAGIMRPSK